MIIMELKNFKCCGGKWIITETYAAKALAIDEEGRLVVQRENGRPQALRCGEVTTRPARTE